MYQAWDQGFAISVLQDVRPACNAGPARLVIVKSAGRVTEVRLAVGVEWRPSRLATDFGQVAASEAALWLVQLAETGDDDVTRVALLAASIADSARITARVLAMARNRGLANGTREQAVRWATDVAAAEGRADEADEALKAVASDGREPLALRERAIRSLRPTPANRAFLRSLYGRAAETTLRERIIRQIGEHGSDDDVAWVREVALNERETLELRERAVRVLREELGRTADVRALYGRLDRAELKERVLRVVAEHGDPAADRWLREVATDSVEPLAVRDRALRLMGEHGDLTALLDLYPRLDRIELRERVVRIAAERGDDETLDWLRRIVLDETGQDGLRDRAVRSLAEARVPTADLVSLYDRVQGTAVKQRLVRVFGERRDDAAVKKLAAIAERDPDPALRRDAERRLNRR
jgi:hypothetical protein